MQLFNDLAVDICAKFFDYSNVSQILAFFFHIAFMKAIKQSYFNIASRNGVCVFRFCAER